MSIKKIFFLFVAILSMTMLAEAQRPITSQSFAVINLNYKGLEKIKALTLAGRYNDAATALLSYYRNRTDIKAIKFIDKPSKNEQEIADSALLHLFKPHKGYGFFDYGKDINWQLWPIKDNEVRWQLHRLKWWPTMGQVYRVTGDEKYAQEFIAQFRNWVLKNPRGLSKDNDEFVWRALEISERLNNWPDVFGYFVTAKAFTPTFLMEFLNTIADHADYLKNNYAELGNHRLFEAQRELGMGCFLPELTHAAQWRKSGISILTEEINKQVYPDGMQWELAPGYHKAMISTFLDGLRSAEKMGLGKEFSPSYKATIEKMILATINFSFPDFSSPMFGDAWPGDKAGMLKNYANWGKDFPNNPVIQYYATGGKKGSVPNWLSNALSTAGFYTFRAGWDMQSTVMVLKASPPGEFHAQPDNGTFELWIKGRNFTPDAGCYLYSGDTEVTKRRNWFRQSRVHSTLTLNNENMVLTKAQQQKWETGKDLDVLTYTNPSYTDLKHQRSVLFIDQKYFLIIDKASGTGQGTLGTHFQLKEDSKPVYDKAANRVYTTYADGNNLLIQNLNTDKVTMTEEEGRVSYEYNKYLERPAFVFEKQKASDNTQIFITLVVPFDGDKAPQISLSKNKDNNFENGKIDLQINLDGKKRILKTNLY